jgi:predicted esterase
MDQDWEWASFDILPNGLSMSGFSSGGFMVTNMLVMFKEVIAGMIGMSSGPCANAGICFLPQEQRASYPFPIKNSLNALQSLFIYEGAFDPVVPKDFT